MKIDLQTLKELEIFSYDTHTTNVFEMLDETITPGGQYKLKQNFKKPFSNIKEIEETQDAIKYILLKPNNWQLPVSAKLMDLLDVYYFSKSRPSIAKNFFSRILENISYRFFYKDFKATFLRGTRHIISFIKLVNTFFLKHPKKDLPKMLNDYFIQMAEILELAPLQEILKKQDDNSLSTMQLMKYDKIFRETNKTELLKLIDLIYEFDVLISKAKACLKFELKFPEFIDSEKSHFEIKEVYHLFVKEPVKNDINPIVNKHFIFLTGPNMAGKTTFLKSCGLAIFLAHLGMGVPANQMRLSLFDQIFSSLNVSDNLPKGYSYFYSEVKRVKEAGMALHESKKVFVIFDELFKGTNVKDAFDGSLLVIKELVKWTSSFFILSSHLLELGKEIENLDAIRFLCFDSRVENGKPYFNYKIKEGLSDERLGLIILKNEEVFKILNPENKLNKN